MNRYLRMLAQGMDSRLMDEAGADGADGAGGGNEEQAQPTIEQLQEQLTKLQEQNNQLTQQNTTLAEQHKANEAAAAKAQKEAETKALEASKQAGKFEEYEKLLKSQYDEQITGYQSQIESLQNEILTGHKGQAIESLAGMFQSPEGGKLMLQAMVSTSRDDQGNIVTQFSGVDGQMVATNLEQFKVYLSNNKAMAPFLNGPGSSGGGGQGGPANGQGGKNTISRAEFEGLSNAAKADFIGKGGKLRD